MKRPYRKYGTLPVSVVLLHGGPGAIGEMAPVAQRLSTFCGVLEFFQTKFSISEELLELKNVIKKESLDSIVLIGHSFGAWMCCLFAAQYPSFVNKIILIGCPPFETQYVASIMKTRVSRMSSTEIEELNGLKLQMRDSKISSKDSLFSRFGNLFQKVDSFDPICHKNEEYPGSFRIYEKIWDEAQSLRSSGALVKCLEKITCPITAIHGEYDPHPIEGAFHSLSHCRTHFQPIILKECGHTPWVERRAQDQFFNLLQKEILFHDNR